MELARQQLCAKMKTRNANSGQKQESVPPIQDTFFTSAAVAAISALGIMCKWEPTISFLYPTFYREQILTSTLKSMGQRRMSARL